MCMGGDRRRMQQDYVKQIGEYEALLLMMVQIKLMMVDAMNDTDMPAMRSVPAAGEPRKTGCALSCTLVVDKAREGRYGKHESCRSSRGIADGADAYITSTSRIRADWRGGTGISE